METERVCVVYNPYILHLLYVKMRYMRQIVMRYYRRYSDKAEDVTRLMDYCVLNDAYTQILTRDLEVMQAFMQKEEFPMPLYYCHYEYYLFRLSQVFKAPGDSIDALYVGNATSVRSMHSK